MLTIDQTVAAINSRRAICSVEYSATDDVFQQTNAFENFIDNVIDGVKAFIRDYVDLPSKETFLSAVEAILEEGLAMVNAPNLVKSLVKRMAMKAASQLYDAAIERLNMQGS